MPLTPERIECYLSVLRQCGSKAEASRLASPAADQDRSDNHGPGYESFRDLRSRDPEFQRREAEALSEYQGVLESHVSELVLKGTRRPICQGGKIVAEEQCFPIPLVIRALSRLDRSWCEHSTSESKVEVTSKNLNLELSLSDMDLLTPEEREIFTNILRSIQSRRQERDAPHNEPR